MKNFIITLSTITNLVLADSTHANTKRDSECSSLTRKFKAEKSFTPCKNIYAGHDIYFSQQSCPIPSPRLCIEPLPLNKFVSINYAHDERKEVSLRAPDNELIPFANMTMITSRIRERPSDQRIPMDCLWCWNYTYQTELWSKYVDGIEKTVGIKFSNGPIRTMLEFGCGSGGFLGEMATRGIVGICTAREISNAEGSETYLPYLRTVAARGLIAMHISITSHQPFLSSSFDFIHCSWVLAYVPPTPRFLLFLSLCHLLASHFYI